MSSLSSQKRYKRVASRSHNHQFIKAFTLGLSNVICCYILASKLQKLPLSGLPIVKKFTMVLQYHLNVDGIVAQLQK